MNSLKRLLVLTFVTFTFASGAYAADTSSGCGLGWEVFKKNSLVSSSLRATTNAIALNTIAMTSGTSGCAKHDIVLKQKAALYFAEANYQKLQSEMAAGQGEHVVAFAKLLGCKGNLATDAGRVLQGNYDQVFTSDQVLPADMLSNTARTIHQSGLNCAFGS